MFVFIFVFGLFKICSLGFLFMLCFDGWFERFVGVVFWWIFRLGIGGLCFLVVVCCLCGGECWWFLESGVEVVLLWVCVVCFFGVVVVVWMWFDLWLCFFCGYFRKGFVCVLWEELKELVWFECFVLVVFSCFLMLWFWYIGCEFFVVLEATAE